MMWILLRIVDHVGNQLSGSTELHWTKAEGSIGAECLLEYSPAQPPTFTIPRMSKAKIKITCRTSVTDLSICSLCDSRGNSNRNRRTIGIYIWSFLQKLWSDGSRVQDNNVGGQNSDVHYITWRCLEHVSQVCTTLTILCLPFCKSQPNRLSINREDASQEEEWGWTSLRGKRTSFPLAAVSKDPLNCPHSQLWAPWILLEIDIVMSVRSSCLLLTTVSWLTPMSMTDIH